MPSTDQVFHKRELEKGFYYAQAVKAGNTPMSPAVSAGTPQATSLVPAT